MLDVQNPTVWEVPTTSPSFPLPLSLLEIVMQRFVVRSLLVALVLAAAPLTARADEGGSSPLVTTVSSLLAVAIGAIAAGASSKKQIQEKIDAAVDTTVGARLGTFAKVGQREDLSEYVRTKSGIVVLGKDGDRAAEMGLRQQGWRNVRTCQIPVVPEPPPAPPGGGKSVPLPDEVTHPAIQATQIAAVEVVGSADVIFFDRVGGHTIQAVAQAVPRHGYGAFTRGYLDIPSAEIRDRVVFGNSPPNARFWLERVATETERARRALDPNAPATT